MTASSETQHHDFLPASVRAAAPYFILVLAVFAAYINIFDNQFLFDDDLLIKINAWIRDWHHIGDIVTGSTTGGAHIAGGFYRPVQILLYLAMFQLGDGSTVPFHLLNLSLHIANTCFVYRLGNKMGFKQEGVFLAALIWGLHPLHTEAVTYMSATADPLFSFCCLLSIILLLPDITPRKIWMIFPLYLLGLFTKETMVMFPALVMACLYFMSPDRLKLRTYWRTWPLWIVSIGFVIWRMHAPGFDGPQTYGRFYALSSFSPLKMYAEHPLYRFYTFLATLYHYLKLMIWPTGLHMERGFPVFTDFSPPPVLCGLALLLLGAFVVGRSFRPGNPDRAMAWGFLWFAAAHGPDSGLLIPMNSLFLEHWMYLPSVGLFLGGTETLAKFLEKRPAYTRAFCSGVLLIMAVVFSVKTSQQNKIWHDPDSFYNNIFAYGETSARARNNLALYYSDHGNYAGAITQFQEAIKESDAYAETHYNLALNYLRDAQGDYVQNAINQLNLSLKIDPNFYRSYFILGDIYSKFLHDQKKSDEYHDRAIELIHEPK